MSWRCYDTCCQSEQYDWPDYLVLSRRHVRKSRKPHPCRYCGAEIPAGSECSSETALSAGQVATTYRHYPPTCGSEQEGS